MITKRVVMQSLFYTNIIKNPILGEKYENIWTSKVITIRLS